MTRAINDSLSARVTAHPDQWYWLLGRWQGADAVRAEIERDDT
jgi:KDO2-lipid IV(A) lauroyltransferase